MAETIGLPSAATLSKIPTAQAADLMPLGVYIASHGRHDVFRRNERRAVLHGCIERCRDRWTQEGAGTIGNEIVSIVDVRQSDRYVVAATWGNGMFFAMYPDHPNVIAEPNVPAPQSMLLRTKFSKSLGGSAALATTIGFTIPDALASSVSLKLCDETGRVVRTLVNGVLPPGDHDVMVNADALPDGVYYYRLQAGSLTQTRAMRIVR